MTKYKKALLCIICIGIIAAGFQITLRVIKEQRNRVVEIVADLDSFTDLSYEIGEDAKSIMKELRINGVNSIAVAETTLNKLEKQGKVLLFNGNDMSYLSTTNTYKSLIRMKNYINENSIEYQNVSVIVTVYVNPLGSSS